MNIAYFDDLLRAAQQQNLPQRLLLVFTSAELPADSTAVQRRQFEAGSGGALVPCLCVDKTPEEVGNFASLKRESEQFNLQWQAVFVSTQSDHRDAATASAAAKALERMVAAIKGGALANMIAFDLQGNAMALQ